MVRYTDTPEVNKRMVAGYYLFLCLIGFAILLGPTGSGIPITLVGDEGRYEHEIAEPGWGDNLTAEGCAECHEENYNYWNQTEHAMREVTWNSSHVIGLGHSDKNWTYFNDTCAPCHATGWSNTTGTPVWLQMGVTCIACHNTSEPSLVTYDSETCGTCHNPGYHANRNDYPDWAKSIHANSLTDLRSSDHAASYCMHCMATEAFVHQQNPGSLSDDVDTGFAVNGTYTSISCPACHAVHSNWSLTSPAQIRAVNASELCGLCHVGTHHPHYEVWIGGSHNLAGVECTDCHGYDLVFYRGEWRGALNHTFVVDPELACGQEGCHEDTEAWALGQLEMRQSAFDALTEEILDEAESLAAIVDAYNATAGANVTLANLVMDAVDDAEALVHYFEYDGSHGFHDGYQIFTELNEVFRELLEAKATFYEYTGYDTVTVTVTETVTVTTTVTVPGGDMLLTVAGAGGGIILGLILGVLVGRRR